MEFRFGELAFRFRSSGIWIWELVVQGLVFRSVYGNQIGAFRVQGTAIVSWICSSPSIPLFQKVLYGSRMYFADVEFMNTYLAPKP